MVVGVVLSFIAMSVSFASAMVEELLRLDDPY